ncbi:MAG: hypothetical protein JWQ25_1168 [Daejeonella sp.]|nr:hypothetical protein [Daejeonella sp.]
MKKNLFYSVALCLLLFSCKKEEQTSAYTEVKSDAKKYAVNFNLSDFTQTVESMGAKGSNTIMSAGSAVKAIDSLKNHIRELRYILYDAAGTPIKTIRQGVNGGGTQFHCATCDSDFGHPDALPYNKPFGTIVDSLPAGNYKAVFLGIRDYNYNMNSRYTDETNWDVNFNSSWVGDNRTLDFQPLWTTGDVFHK